MLNHDPQRRTNVASVASVSNFVRNNIMTFDCPVPSGVVAGDLLVYALVTGQTAVITNPPGFTTIFDDTGLTGHTLRLMQKTAVGTYAGGATFQGSFSTYNDGSTSACLRIVGQNAANPIDNSAHSAHNTYDPSPITIVAPTVSANGARCLDLIIAAGVNNTNTDTTFNFGTATQQVTSGDSSVTTRNQIIGIGSENLVASGATGTFNVGASHPGGAGYTTKWIGARVTIAPA